nr:helix-turn-helix domain-containing protein [Hymenobacter terrenus]
MTHLLTPHTLPARVRDYFGLSCAELALHLRVTEATVRHLETGRRRLTAAVHEALWPLARHLPSSAVPPEAAPALPPPDAAELAYRRLQCAAQGRRLQRELDRLEAQARYGARWAAAAPALLLRRPLGCCRACPARGVGGPPGRRPRRHRP